MKTRSRALVVMLAVFLFGGFIGASGYHLWLQRSHGIQSGIAEGPIPPHRGGGRQRFFGNLQLTPEQEVLFREIMEESRLKLNALRLEQEPKIDAIRAETNKKITSILDETQRRQFEAFSKEIESRAKREPNRKINQRFEGPNGFEDRSRENPGGRNRP